MNNENSSKMPQNVNIKKSSINVSLFIGALLCLLLFPLFTVSCNNSTYNYTVTQIASGDLSSKVNESTATFGQVAAIAMLAIAAIGILLGIKSKGEGIPSLTLGGISIALLLAVKIRADKIISELSLYGASLNLATGFILSGLLYIAIIAWNVNLIKNRIPKETISEDEGTETEPADLENFDSLSLDEIEEQRIQDEKNTAIRRSVYIALLLSIILVAIFMSIHHR